MQTFHLLQERLILCFNPEVTKCTLQGTSGIPTHPDWPAVPSGMIIYKYMRASQLLPLLPPPPCTTFLLLTKVPLSQVTLAENPSERKGQQAVLQLRIHSLTVKISKDAFKMHTIFFIINLLKPNVRARYDSDCYKLMQQCLLVRELKQKAEMIKGNL